MLFMKKILTIILHNKPEIFHKYNSVQSTKNVYPTVIRIFQKINDTRYAMNKSFTFQNNIF